MSIVQDALKKAQDGHAERKKRGHLLPVLLLILLVALLGFAIHRISGPQERAGQQAAITVAKSIITPVTGVNYTPKYAVSSNTAATSRPGRTNRQLPDLVLSGIMQLVDGPRAIINDVIVATGDVINGVTIVKIDKDKVIVDRKGSKMMLGME